MSFEPRYGIFFESENEMVAYDRLLEHPCPSCIKPRVFKNFLALKNHVNQDHQLFFCELCITHLKIFSRERRAYTRSELAHHRRKGDPDDTSHRGHPLCEFCDIRYMDSDELFRHLRKDHFYCHFCDADGKHQFYDDYPALREHFRDSHYLCEEGDCKNEQFTAVFRDKIDLQGHFLDNHADNKRAARQARTVDIEFTVNHAPSLVHRDDRGRGGRGRGGRGRSGRGGWDDSPPAEELPPPPPPQHSIDINCVQDFPTLGCYHNVILTCSLFAVGNQTMDLPRNSAQSSRSFTLRAMRGNVASMEEEFPALGSSFAASQPSTRGNYAGSPTTSLHLRVNAKRGGGSDGARGGVSIQYSSTSGSTEQKQPKVNRNNNTSANAVSSGKSGNVMPKSKNNFGGGNKENASAKDFPSLRQPSKSLTATFGGADSFNITTAPMQQSSKKPPLASNISSAKTTSVKSKELRINGFQKPPSSKDFPSLGSDSRSDNGMKNYHGMSKVTVPVNNSWTKKTEYVPAATPTVKTPPSEVEPSSSSAVKNTANNKKKNSGAAPPNVVTNGTSQNKKRPLRLGNVFDASDGEEEEEEPNFGVTFAPSRRDYEVYNHVSKVPEASSNMTLLSADTFEARKKSELRIGSLKTPVPKLNSTGQFPSLGGKGGNNSKKKTAVASENNGTANGWANVTSKNPAPKNVKGESSNLATTDMTFHNSYGESYHILPSNDSSNDVAVPKPGNAQKGKKDKIKKHKFIPPEDFEQRNQLLIKTISDQCGRNTEQFKRFKSLAVNLRNGTLDGRAYYEQCRDLMGRKTLLSILPELLGLLPDISMQQAVYTGYLQVDQTTGPDSTLDLNECERCCQVLRSEDLEHHRAVHREADFPCLGGMSIN
ncbi:hypothetical protein HAZT_HAZT001212 [Hyalella azteca]|uniref:C2H2-type domain-containing protein n=1 Tax=Hyalella azteca TaxID=294128 RepID=A0A6A0H4R9_HYAAZ|nr:hypothetical protein HAZT_HAZT001212 [Hyalella azteca]